MSMESKNLLGACVLGLWVAACGEDKPVAHGDHHDAGHVHDRDAAHHAHDSGHIHPEPDGGFPEAPCDPKLPALAIGSEAEGDSKFIYAKVVKVDPLPLLKGTSDWELHFQNKDGDPITDIGVKRAYTYMPVHAHHGTFEPKFSALAEPGNYEFDGFNFTMRGPWQVRLELTSESAGDDFVMFDVCVEPE